MTNKFEKWPAARIGMGVLSWDAEERRGDRYGAVHLGANPYDEPSVCQVEWHAEVVENYTGKRVKLWAVVRETRKSGHLGDFALGIQPETPEVGERVDLGVGVLGLAKLDVDEVAGGETAEEER